MKALAEHSGMKVGDLIETYHNGYFKLIKITPRHNEYPLFTYTKVANKDGTIIRGTSTMQCDGGWCKNAIHSVAKIEEEAEKLKNLSIFIQDWYANAS
jgi:hypothetical protein